MTICQEVTTYQEAGVRPEREAATPTEGASAGTPAPVPITFGPPARRLFGWYHAPRPGLARSPAVVLCSPIGHEALCAHASYRCLAERLAASGYPALRFDYDGTGDSCGSDEDPGRVGSWLASIGCAIDALRGWSRAEGVFLFGVRLGATLAAVAAAERGDVQGLILWAACPSGRSFLRELRVLHAAQGLPVAHEEGDYEEAAGFVFTRETADALGRLDAASLIARPAPAALLIGRDDLPDAPRLGRSLAALGTAVTRAEWPGYAAMMRDPQETQIPHAAIGSLLGWLKERSTAVPAEAPRKPTPGPPVATSLPVATDVYVEEPLRWGDAPRSFGVLTRPRGAGGRPARAAVVLLSVGANHRVGPGRMYVTFARQLAAGGFPVLRLDLPGLGDSAEGGESARRFLYSDAAVPNVRDALSALSERCGAERFVLIGLCSGAYAAYRTAAEDPRVDAQVLINPQTLDWKPGDSLEVLLRRGYYRPSHSYLTLLGRGDALKRVLLRQVDVKGICGALWGRLASASQVALRSLLSRPLRGRAYETPAGRNFRRIAERGADTLLLFAAGDTGLETTLLHLGTSARAIRRLNGLRMEVIEGADHVFTQKAAREKLLSTVAAHLARRYPGAAADA